MCVNLDWQLFLKHVIIHFKTQISNLADLKACLDLFKMALQCYLRPKAQWKGSWRTWNVFSNITESHFNRCVIIKCWYIVHISLQQDSDVIDFWCSLFAGAQIKAKNSYSQKSPRKSKSPKSPAVNASQERNIKCLLTNEWVNLTWFSLLFASWTIVWVIFMVGISEMI